MSEFEAAFRRALMRVKNPAIAELAITLREWVLVERASLDEKTQQLIIVAAGFAIACKPKCFTRQQLDISARLLFLFFAHDDEDQDALPEVDGNQLWEIGRVTPWLRRWIAEFEAFHRAADEDRQMFVDSYYEYLREKKHEPIEGRSRLTIEEHWASRRKTVFLDPFVISGAISSGVSVASLGQDFFACCDDAATAIWLANDLGSIDRDRSESQDPNIVDTYCRVRGLSEEAAYARVISDYNEVVGRLGARMQALGRTVKNDDVARFIDIVAGCVEGNLIAMRELDFRYSAIDRLLAQVDHL
ncbi:MAG: hypothetical protein HC927_09790 [Deltaproteobacteria bacterium]|nr:hypothetical protein [Deltaproteobacteria bacterium]